MILFFPSLSRIEVLLGLFDLEQLARVGGDDLVFTIGGDHFDSRVLGSGEENPLSHIALEQEEFLMIREIKRFRHQIDRGRRLAQEELHRRVGDDRLAVARRGEISDILGNGRQPRIVFAAALGDPEEKSRSVLVLHHHPGLIHHDDALFHLGADLVPDELQDDIHRDRPELIFQVADIEDHQLIVVCLFKKPPKIPSV